MKFNPPICFYGHLYPGTLCSLLGLWERENATVMCLWVMLHLLSGPAVALWGTCAACLSSHTVVSEVSRGVLWSRFFRPPDSCSGFISISLTTAGVCCCFCVLLLTQTPPPTTNLNPHDHVECQTLFHPSLLQHPPQRLWLASMKVLWFGALRVTWPFPDFITLLFSWALVELSQSKRIKEKPKPELANHLNAFTVRNLRNVCC